MRTIEKSVLSVGRQEMLIVSSRFQDRFQFDMTRQINYSTSCEQQNLTDMISKSQQTLTQHSRLLTRPKKPQILFRIYFHMRTKSSGSTKSHYTPLSVGPKKKRDSPFSIRVDDPQRETKNTDPSSCYVKRTQQIRFRAPARCSRTSFPTPFQLARPGRPSVLQRTVSSFRVWEHSVGNLLCEGGKKEPENVRRHSVNVELGLLQPNAIGLYPI